VGIGYFALYSALTAWLALKTRLAAIVLTYFILSMGNGLFFITFGFIGIRFFPALSLFFLMLLLFALTWFCLRGLMRQLTRHVEAS
jgi:hypothetical protein